MLHFHDVPRNPGPTLKEQKKNDNALLDNSFYIHFESKLRSIQLSKNKKKTNERIFNFIATQQFGYFV